jgi:glutamate-ammonia-ligase adenylyltransferase
LVNTISAMTRDGNLYRVDLRLRPYGSKGLTAISSEAFLRYMRETAAIWELLAFVRLRAVGGNIELAGSVERETRTIIHERAVEIDRSELAAETTRVRHSLEQQRAQKRRSKEIDIKYGSGGMLDVYFAMRFLQLRDNVPDDSEDRSTPFMLKRLAEAGSLTGEELNDLHAGYEFLSTVDHNLRLTVGRTNRIPLANETALKTVAKRMNLDSPADLLEQLTLHRISVREAFNNIVS